MGLFARLCWGAAVVAFLLFLLTLFGIQIVSGGSMYFLGLAIILAVVGFVLDYVGRG